MSAKDVIDIVQCIATVLATVAAFWVVCEMIRTRRDEKMPVVTIRAREKTDYYSERRISGSEWWLRLVNVGSGPAFIKKFTTQGIPGHPDGEHTQSIDTLLGPDNGDSDLQIAFAKVAGPKISRDPAVHIEIIYEYFFKRKYKTTFANGRVKFH